ncbi:MAG: type II toxin-antitoxin system RelE/ParE family toxin [Notoacmeibacter sp.]
MRVDFTATAERDLRGIALFIAMDNRSKAIEFTLELRAKAKALGEFPDRYAIVIETNGLIVRRRPAGNYLIYYIHFADRISVLRIVNAAIATDEFTQFLLGTT